MHARIVHTYMRWGAARPHLSVSVASVSELSPCRCTRLVEVGSSLTDEDTCITFMLVSDVLTHRLCWLMMYVVEVGSSWTEEET